MTANKGDAQGGTRTLAEAMTNEKLPRTLLRSTTGSAPHNRRMKTNGKALHSRAPDDDGLRGVRHRGMARSSA